ncbi:hypothetical protein [Vampirovibrio chlorellavorus]|uniref:hypothetical protein n=1 Tax=Vampirovibrio chlorellavorus TaxID=758823 RepID=UPI0026EEC8E2|nr:hypothetical protein [Vampirovibrio chlorellavorus]
MINTTSNSTQNPIYKSPAKNAGAPKTKQADPKPSAPPLTVADDKTLQAFIDARGEAAKIAAQILKERKQAAGRSIDVLV